MHKIPKWQTPSSQGPRLPWQKHWQQNRLQIFYLLLRSLLGSILLYLFVQSLNQAHAGSAISLFLLANLIFIILLLSPQFSLRIAWAVLGFFLLYVFLQAVSDYFAVLGDDSNFTMRILYQILHIRMSLTLASLLLGSGIIALRFAKYRSVEAVLLFTLSFFLLTRKELSLSFENRYSLYRLLWLALPTLNLFLLGLSLHPRLRRERSFISSVSPTFSPPHGSALRQLRKRGKQIASCAMVFLLLFALLWLTKVSPVNWNHRMRSTSSGNGLLQKNLSNQFDFGEYLRLDSSLEQDRQLVMMAKVEDLAQGRPSYLLRFTLSGLDGKRSFFRDAKEPNMPGESPLPLELESGTSRFQMPQYDLRQQREGHIFLLNIKPSSLFVFNYPTEVQTFETWPDSSFSRVYRMESRILQGTFSFGKTLERYPEILPAKHLDYYTQVPETYRDIGEFTLQLLQKWGRSDLPQQMPLELAQLISSYFHREYRYSLKPGIAKDGDQLRHFLFQNKKGYCTYFAFSAALMLRFLGVPTRIAVGFLVNPELRILDYYPIFADQAHAWIEVFDPEQGWVTFDPTTFTLAPGEEIEFGLPEGSEADLAALTEELLRNQLLNAEAGLQQLVAEPSKGLLAQWLETLQHKSWLLPGFLLVLLLALLFSFRLYLLQVSLYKPIKNTDRPFTKRNKIVIMAMYYYLQWLNYPISFCKLPRRLHAWQENLELTLQVEAPYPRKNSRENSREKAAAVKRHALLQGSQDCLPLFQKYFFSQEFTSEDCLQLRRKLKTLQPNNWNTWNPWFLACILYRFCFHSRHIRDTQ